MITFDRLKIEIVALEKEVAELTQKLFEAKGALQFAKYLLEEGEEPNVAGSSAGQ